MYYFIKTQYSGKRGVYMPVGINHATTKVCEHCSGRFVEYSAPIQFEIKGEPCDYYLHDGLLFISQRCLDALQELNLTGYSVRPAKVTAWNKALPETDLSKLVYYQLVVTGRCGSIRDMQAQYLPKCEVCGRKFVLKQRITGVMFEEADYDGSDIFAFHNLYNIPIISEDVKKKLRKLKLSNMKFVPLNETEMG